MPKLRLPTPLRFPLIALAALVAIGGGWGAWWWAASQMLHRSLDEWIATTRQQGNAVQVGDVTFGGFPLRLRATLTDVSVKRRDGIAWAGPKVVVEAPLWHVTTLALGLSGRHEVRIPNESETMLITVTGGTGSVTLGGAAGITDAQAHLSGITVQPSERGSLPVTVATLELSATLPRDAVRKPDDTGLLMTMEAATVDLPPDESLPLGSGIDSLAVVLRVQGGAPTLTAAELAAWRQSGGTLALDSARLHWGPLTLGAEGTLKLDRDLQPEGILTTEITGFGPAIDALVAAGWVKAKQGQTAKAVLKGLSGHHNNNDEPTARIPVSLHDHFLHLGPFRLLALPTIYW